VSSFDDDLETEVQKILHPGEEGIRSAAVRELHQSSQLGVVFRVGGAVVGIAVAVAIFYAVGAILAVQSIGDLCGAVGLCG
jgi:hypothetical protein